MSHDHTMDVKSNRFIFSLVLTGLIFFAEFFGGLWTGSLALLSVSAHVFMDAFALGLSYLALSAHATISDQAISQIAEIMAGIKDALHEQFEIHHTTIQFECSNCGQGVMTCNEL